MPPPLSLLALLLAGAAASSSAAAAPAGAAAVPPPPKPPCPLATAKPAAVAVRGYGTSADGCIGAQGHDTKRQLAMSVGCGTGGLNVSAAAAVVSKLCDATPGCAAFSIISPAYSGCKKSGALLCEIHPETIAQSSQANQWWSVWQKTSPLKPGAWPYAPGAAGPPSPPPPPPAAKPIRPDLVWTTAPKGATESMPLGNGKLGVNVWADSSDSLWLLVSHVDAVDENTSEPRCNLDLPECAYGSPHSARGLWLWHWHLKSHIGGILFLELFIRSEPPSLLLCVHWCADLDKLGRVKIEAILSSSIDNDGDHQGASQGIAMQNYCEIFCNEYWT